jgi:hypothetical protein
MFAKWFKGERIHIREREMESHRRILFETASHRQAPLLQHGWIAGIYNQKRSFAAVSALVPFPTWMVCSSLHSSVGSDPGREKVNKKKSYVCVEGTKYRTYI